MTVPTNEDWHSEPWGIDTPYAYKLLNGKTVAEAIKLFEDKPLQRSFDLMCVPSRVFRYYFRAFIAYITSDPAMVDGQAADLFISLIDNKAEKDRGDIVSLWPEIEPALKHLAEHPELFDDLEWVLNGSFHSRIRKIVERGFSVSFEIAFPETVPSSVTLREMARSNRWIPLSIAAQIFIQSGISGIDASSHKQDILRVLGPPDDAGGGNHPKFGQIPHWICYNRQECCIRFELDGDVISSVLFMPLRRAPQG